jgi:PKHD-type hydroxylase
MENKLVFPRDQSVDQTLPYIFEEAFNAEELEWINNLQELYPFQEATIIGNNNNIRKSEIKWLHNNERSFWVYEKICRLAMQANNEIWKFNLHSVIDAIQYTVYYEGGGLEIWSGGEFKTIERKQGSAIFFPSFLMHRVTPITKGTRKSLVLWMGGDSYK